MWRSLPRAAVLAHDPRPTICARRFSSAPEARANPLAFAITAARIYPTMKYALGHGRACMRVSVGGATVPVLRQAA
jgi:hypothetical protein